MTEDFEDRLAHGAGSGLFLIAAVLFFAGMGWAAKEAITEFVGLILG